jgi:pyruvate dehydrogenase E1 component
VVGSATLTASAYVERLLAPIASGAALDGHPAAHAWLGGVARHRVVPFGADRFGESVDIPGSYREYGLDVDAILDACAQALLT